jgi:phosphoribosylanthranilate isomerase
MWIKICANTNLEDAKLAAELGADALGFVFAPSPRRVTSAEVAKITPHLPSAVERVGVFHAVDAYEIARAAHEAGLTAVQLHSGVCIASTSSSPARSPSSRRFTGRSMPTQPAQ